jgi:hypothetical protein
MKIVIRQVADQDQGTWRPTGYMEKVSRAVEAEPGLNIRQVREAVPGGNEYIDRALDLLVREEWMERRKRGAAQCHYVLRAYREDTDPDRAGNRAETVPKPCRISLSVSTPHRPCRRAGGYTPARSTAW